LTVLATLFAVSAGQAQAGKYLYVGGGATLPMGDYKDFGGGDGAKTGFMADVGLGTNLGSSGKMFGFVDMFYGKNSHDTDDESTTLIGGGANIGMQTSGTSSRLYGYVGGGLQSHKYNAAGGVDGGSETNPFARGALGISLGSGNTTFWLEAGYVLGFGDEGAKTSYVPLLAGISIGL
jgi:hypothetical protein